MDGTQEARANQALLIGMVAGLLSTRLQVELEAEEGNYTGRIFISRPSGTYVLTVEPWSES